MSTERRVLAVASAGGHWTQLQRLAPAFKGSRVTFVTTRSGYRGPKGETPIVVKDANADRRLALLIMFLQVAWTVIRLRPHVVISTGAAPGLAAIVVAKLLRRRTIWIDSIANAEELSSSARLVRRWADHWLTQWPHLAKPEGPQYWGNVL